MVCFTLSPRGSPVFSAAVGKIGLGALHNVSVTLRGFLGRLFYLGFLEGSGAILLSGAKPHLPDCIEEADSGGDLPEG